MIFGWNVIFIPENVIVETIEIRAQCIPRG